MARRHTDIIIQPMFPDSQKENTIFKMYSDIPLDDIKATEGVIRAVPSELGYILISCDPRFVTEEVLADLREVQEQITDKK